MKSISTILGLLVFIISYSQENAISLQECYDEAVKNYPLTKQRELLNSTNELKILNLQKNYLPQISLNGQATYQSEVTSVKINMPDITVPIGDPPLTISPPNPDVPEIPKDMYKLTLDVNQMIYDGGITKRQKELQVLGFEIDKQNLEIELYKLKENINQVYFSIVLLKENKKLLNIIKVNIEAKLSDVESGVSNGILLASNADILRAEILKVEQEIAGIDVGIESAFDILRELTGMEIPDGSELVLPDPVVNTEVYNNERLEYTLFDMQKSRLNSMKTIIDAKKAPKFFGFGQLGYGRPGLDMFAEDFSPYYLVGVGLSWDILNWKENNNEKSILELQNNILDTQKETFDKNIRIASRKQIAEIKKFEVLIEKDDQLIELRTKITETASSQLNNGVITSTEYLTQLNEEKQAKLNREKHKIQLINAKLNYLSAIGKL